MVLMRERKRKERNPANTGEAAKPDDYDCRDSLDLRCREKSLYLNDKGVLVLSEPPKVKNKFLRSRDDELIGTSNDDELAHQEKEDTDYDKTFKTIIRHKPDTGYQLGVKEETWNPETLKMIQEREEEEEKREKKAHHIGGLRKSTFGKSKGNLLKDAKKDRLVVDKPVKYWDSRFTKVIQEGMKRFAPKEEEKKEEKIKGKHDKHDKHDKPVPEPVLKIPVEAEENAKKLTTALRRVSMTNVTDYTIPEDPIPEGTKYNDMKHIYVFLPETDLVEESNESKSAKKKSREGPAFGTAHDRKSVFGHSVTDETIGPGCYNMKPYMQVKQPKQKSHAFKGLGRRSDVTSRIAVGSKGETWDVQVDLGKVDEDAWKKIPGHMSKFGRELRNPMEHVATTSTSETYDLGDKTIEKEVQHSGLKYSAVFRSGTKDKAFIDQVITKGRYNPGPGYYKSFKSTFDKKVKPARAPFNISDGYVTKEDRRKEALYQDNNGEYELDEESKARRKELFKKTLKRFQKLMRTTQPVIPDEVEVSLEQLSDFGKGTGHIPTKNERFHDPSKSYDVDFYVPKSTISVKNPEKPSTSFISKQPRFYSEADLCEGSREFYKDLKDENRASSFVNVDPTKYNLCHFDVFDADDLHRSRWGAKIGTATRFEEGGVRQHNQITEDKNKKNPVISRILQSASRPSSLMKEKLYVVNYNAATRKQRVISQRVRQIGGVDTIFNSL